MNNQENQGSDNHPTGSILIWTTLLGIILTSTFFFFAVRLNSNTAIQRNSIIHQNQKAYLKSYAGYLESIKEGDIDILEGIRDDGISTEGITGIVTNQKTEITGVLDSGETKTYTFNKDVNIEWNLCEKNEKESIKIDISEYSHDDISTCTPVEIYDDLATITVSPTPIALTSLNAPLHYRITPINPTETISDTKWTMDLKVKLGYGKKIEMERTFTPQ